ncbi:MAG: thiamine phosphate synthase [Campylobacter sp.]|nr:thiamine phosphate synthase [Campylobacter sp.]
MEFKNKLYFIAGSINGGGVNKTLEILKNALDGGIDVFQFREKGVGALVGDEKERFALECFELCKSYNVPFLVNDDINLAMKIGADGVHIGQDDGNLAEITKLFKGKIVGISAHNFEEISYAKLIGATYAGLGPIFATTSKDDAQSPIGVENLAKLKANFNDFEVLAIGGINLNNAKSVLKTGVEAICVISAICKDREFVSKFKALKD